MGEPIRVILKVNEDSHPELYEDLKNIDPRRRGERLRLLATAELRSQVEGRPQGPTPPRRRKSQGPQDGETQKEQTQEARKESEPVKANQEPQAIAEENDKHQEVRNSLLGGIANQF